MSGEVRNVDALIVADMQNQQAPVQAIPNAPIESAPVQQDSVAEVPHGTLDSSENEHTNDNVNQVQPDANVTQEPTKSVETSSKSVDSPIDEYGNPIDAPKMYSEEDVSRMIRDRLSRGRHAEQPTQQQVQKAADDFKTDPNSEESWETQLEGFIDKTLEKRQSKQAEQQWKQQEAAKQAEFEAKFSTGMNKYQDFHKVIDPVRNNITDSMMLAARNLDNPAAFIYGAAKLHPQELDRISRIADPYAQASEVGRLHERMVKSRSGLSAAPKPLEAVKGDVTNKRMDDRPSIDNLIAQHAKQKQNARR